MMKYIHRLGILNDVSNFAQTSPPSAHLACSTIAVILAPSRVAAAPHQDAAATRAISPPTLKSGAVGASLSEMCSIVVSRPLVVCVNIGLFLLNVGLAILLIRKPAAANLAGFVCCVPAISNGSSIGYRFLNVTRR
jgi:hypothetical protein